MTDYNDIDLVYLWLDFNDTWLKTACTEMIRSAQRAMPGINIIQISDQAARKHPLANSAMVFDKIVDRSDLAAFKGYAFAEHALRTERPMIFCDVDLIWGNEIAAETLIQTVKDGQIFVQARTSDEFAILPFDTALILAKPNREFWMEYRRRCDSCKPGFREWWGDQIAMATLPSYINAGRWLVEEPTEMLTERDPTVAALHFAAHRDWLVPYARLLDGGAPFEALMPRLDDISYETDTPAVEGSDAN